MKPLASLLCGGIALSLTACTTLENRRDLYSPQEVNGPYTRMLKHGVPESKTETITVSGTTDYKAVR